MSSNQEVMVTVLCLTYNHMAYIKQCLDGFLMQDTSFKFEVIVHDDASTDGTTEILKEYVLKYPDIIRPIIETENQYTKVGFSGMFLQMSRKSNGKYIALCEGDDYWTDPYKLQKQVDFLESHPDYVMCSHRFNQYIQDKNLLEEEKDLTFQGVDYDLKNLICGQWLTQTLSVVYRCEALNLESFALYGISYDIILFYALLKNGKGYCFPDIMGVYRVHKGGIWSGVSLNNQRLMDFKQRLAIYKVEKSDDAAMSILFLFTKVISRVWMLKQWRLIMEVVQILKKYYGNRFVNKLLFSKLFLGKSLNWKVYRKITER